MTKPTLCAIYKSPKRDLMYLFVRRKDDFSDVPPALLTGFGEPQFVMVVKLDERRTLAQSDIDEVREALAGKGYFLQMPPADPWV